MGRLLRFFRLPAAEQWLLVKAALLLGAIRTALKLLPFPTVRTWLDAAGRRPGGPLKASHSAEQLALAVDRAGRLLPGGDHCLSQALSLRVLMLRRGHACKLCFGVNRSAGSGLAAHAWLEHEGTVLIGGENLHRLVQLAPPADLPS